MVSRRRQRPIERGNPLLKQWQKAMIERGNPLKQVKNKTLNTHRLGLFSTDKGEQILADCQAEIRKHEFQAESQQEELHRAQAEERHRRDQQLLHEQLLKLNWDLREAHEKSLKEMEELKVSEFHLRHKCKTKISRGSSGDYFGAYWQDTRIAKWN